MRYIAFLDILGFAALVENQPLQNVIGKLRLTLGSGQFALALGYMPTDAVQAETKARAKLNLFSFSDTFVISSADDSPESLFAIVAGTRVLTQHLFAYGLPVRGAITCGEAEAIPGTNHFVGRAIIRAAKLEKNQRWFGVALDPEMMTAERIATLRILHPAVVEYTIPWKDNQSIGWTINWRFNLQSERGIEPLFSTPQNDEDRAKRENTLEFCRFLRAKGLTYGEVRDAKGNRLRVPWLAGMFIGSTEPGKRKGSYALEDGL